MMIFKKCLELLFLFCKNKKKWSILILGFQISNPCRDWDWPSTLLQLINITQRRILSGGVFTNNKIQFLCKKNWWNFNIHSGRVVVSSNLFHLFINNKDYMLSIWVEIFTNETNTCSCLLSEHFNTTRHI